MLTVEDRGVEDGDQTVIDFEGFVDGKGFEGGKAEDYPLTIGSPFLYRYLRGAADRQEDR